MHPITPVSNAPSPSVTPAHSNLDLTHLSPSERPLSMRVSPRDRQPNSAQNLESKKSEPSSKIIIFDKSNWESYWSHAKALVVGMSIPGNNNVVTVALDAHDLQSLVLGTKADYEKDIMDLCDQESLHKQFSRIVFHGCCPITRSMGSVDCGGMKKYKGQIVARDLAEKISKLVSDKGGFLFFRHCIKGDGIWPIKDNRNTRKKFITAFKDKGFFLVSSASAPYRIKIENPVSDLPDPDPRIMEKWSEKNGAIIFYKPPIT